MNSSISSSEASSSVADFSWSTTSTDSASAGRKNRGRALTGGNSDEAHSVEVVSSASGSSRRRRQTDGVSNVRWWPHVVVSCLREVGVWVVRRLRTTFTRPSQMFVEEQLRFSIVNCFSVIDNWTVWTLVQKWVCQNFTFLATNWRVYTASATSCAGWRPTVKRVQSTGAQLTSHFGCPRTRFDWLTARVRDGNVTSQV